MKDRPVIGIYARRSNKGTKAGRPFKGLTGVFQRLQEAAFRQDTISYVFTPEDVDFNSDIVRGSVIRDGVWCVEDFPLPDTIYDRGFFIKPTPDEKQFAREFRQDVRERGILYLQSRKIPPIVNDKYSFATLMEQEGISHPKTVKYSDSSVVEMLDTPDFLYAKPIDGAMGIGIITIRKNSKKSFDVRFKKQIVGKQFKVVTLSDVRLHDVSSAVGEARDSLGTQERSYIIQEAIATYEHQEKQADIRVVVQRGREGIAGVTGMIARIGGNFSQGGELQSPDGIFEVLSIQAGKSVSYLRKATEDISLRCFVSVEKEAGVEASDLGVDVVFGCSAEPLIIEANIKQGDLFTKLIRFVKGTSLEEKVSKERDLFFDNTMGFGIRQVLSR